MLVTMLNKQKNPKGTYRAFTLYNHTSYTDRFIGTSKNLLKLVSVETIIEYCEIIYFFIYKEGSTATI